MGMELLVPATLVPADSAPGLDPRSDVSTRSGDLFGLRLLLVLLSGTFSPLALAFRKSCSVMLSNRKYPGFAARSWS